MPQRTYSEEEVVQLLKRAAELEASRSGGSDDKPGLTLDEIVAMAADAGLDPEHLRIAAREMAVQGRIPSTEKVNYNGAEMYVERWVEGRLEEGVIEDLIAQLRHHHDSKSAMAWGMPHYGNGTSTVQTIGRNVEWQHLDLMGMYETKVFLQPRGDQIKMRVSLRATMGGNWENMPVLNQIMGLSAAVPLGIVALVVSGSVLLAGAVGLGAYVAGLQLFRTYFRRSSTKFREKLQKLADDVFRQIADSAVQPAERADERKSRATRPLINDLENIDPADPEATRSDRRIGLR